MNVTDTLTQISNQTTKAQADNVVTGKSDLGQDDFLKLLMTQLKYQDPMNPLSNEDFIAQQAQFTQISELQKINKAMNNSNQMMQASSLIGKTVTLWDPDNPTEMIEGRVKEAKLSDKGSSILINDKEYPMDSVLSIKEGSTAGGGS